MLYKLTSHQKMKFLVSFQMASSLSSSLKLNHLRKTVCYFLNQNRCYAKLKHAASTSSSSSSEEFEKVADDVPTSGICRPLSEILKELNKKVPDSLVKTRIEKDGFPIRYIPWHIVNRVLNLHAPEWSGEVRNITYSADAKSVSVVYRVTLYGTDAEIFRESTGTASIDDTSYGDPVQKAEAMAFRRACARFGLGLHLYHEESS